MKLTSLKEKPATKEDIGRSLLKELGCKTPKNSIKNNKREYHTWYGMLNRCYRKEDIGYIHYGSKSIKVCKRWFDFGFFLKDMGKRPESFVLDRVDNKKGYEPNNCRWVNLSESNKNKSYKNSTNEKYINYDKNRDKYILTFGTKKGRFFKRYDTFLDALKAKKELIK